MAHLHAPCGGRDHGIGRRNDMGGGVIILGQPDRFGGIIRLKAANEVDAGPGEGIDVLVIVAPRDGIWPRRLAF